MNKIFKIVFNKETGVFTAVAEFAKAQGKSSSCTVGSKSSRFVAQTFTLTALAAGMMLSSSVWAYSSMNGRVLAGDNDKTLAMMDNAVVQASEGIAIGNSATSYSNASGQSAQNVAIGHEAKAITGGVAIGYQANTLNSSQQKGTNQQSVAIGYQTVASGDQSTALGAQSKAAGNSSVAIGGDDLDKVASSRPPAWDDQTLSAEDAKGLNNTVAAKKYEQLTGDILVHFENSLVRGNQVTKTAGMPNRYTGTEAGEGSVAVGVQSQAKGSLATAFGTRTSASGTASVALGVGALATNDGSFAGAAGAQSTGISSIALGTGSKAQGNQSLAMGDSAQATADNAYAIGTDAKATEVGAIAQGLTANASAVSAISIGRETNATKENAVALSRLANATGEAANAIGFRSEAHGTNSVALGTQTVATAGATAAVAIGEQANASNTKSIAIGAASKSSGDKSIAVGDSANATNTHSFAMGGQSLSTGTNAVAVGSNTKATGNFSTAISNNANASAHQALAVGVDSVSSKTYATAIGSSAKATGTGSYAGGREANATADYAIAVGNKASSAANGSIAIGNESSVISTGTNSVALGYKASATQQSSTSLGREATTASNYSTAVGANANVGENLIGAVALGTFSTAQAGVSTNEATVNGITYSGFAGNSILHRSGTESYVVSVGDANTKRQIQNVAAGQITKTSTDAINGSQLYMVADEVAKSREKVTSDDKTVTVKESKDSSSSTVFDLSINKSKLQVRQPADDFVYPDAVVVEAATGKVFAPNEEPAPTFVTADVLANTVANSGFRVAGNGTATEEVVNPGDTVNFVDGNGTKATASVVDGKNTVKYDVKVDNNTIKVGTDGNLTVNTDALPKAETPKNYFHTNATGQVQTGNDTNLDNVDGIGGAKGVNALAAGINAQANKQGDMAIGTGAVADGFDTNPDATNSGSAMAIGTNAKANGFVSMALGEESNATKNGALAVGSKAKATEGSAVALGRGAVSSGESATALGASSTAAAKFSIASGVQSQAVGIQSIALGRASVSGSQTATDTIAIGSSSKATETNGIAIGTSTVVSVVDGVALGSKSVASTDKGIVGANPLDANKDESPAWKSTAAAVSVGDVGNGITRQITSVAAGKEDTDAVNVAQLKAVANAARTKVVEGDNIDVSESKNDDGSITYTVATKKDLVVDSVKAGDTTINNEGLKVGDVTVTNSPITVNGDTVNNINEAINKTAEQAFKPLTFGGDTGTDVTRKLGEKVNVKGGATGELSSGNIAVEADGTDTLNIKLAKELKDINSITINNGPTINNNGINMDGDKITNLKDGEDDGDAVNVKQLKESKETVISKDNSIKVTTGKNANGANEFDLSVNKTELKDENNDGKVDAPSNEDGDKLVDAKTVADAINNSGFKLTTSASAGEVSGTTEELINPGDIVTIDAGNNIKVTQAAGKITVETKDNVTFGEKGEDGKPGKDGSVGVNGKDGSAVTLNGKDGSIGL
ncbi:ESPR-type extended signal peptide-containing protein, partial [Mannheimia indoligenes]|uniref:ESPR-type extended signal peptide-containing protein n=1 Tax=Mannheimia indoligenes TaxID=3103145 RepID=UPI002FE5E0C7